MCVRTNVYMHVCIRMATPNYIYACILQLAVGIGAAELDKVDLVGLGRAGVHEEQLACSYGLYSYGPYRHGPYRHGLCSYGLYSHVLYSYGMYSCGRAGVHKSSLPGQK